MDDERPELLFYHLENRVLEQVLPGLLEKCLQRGWRAVVQTSSPERMNALDTLLWTYSEESFLPHATSGDNEAELHPIILTHLGENPNQASVRFITDFATFSDFSSYRRVVFLFDGQNTDALNHARQQWIEAKNTGICKMTYWQEKPGGGWEKKYEV